MAHYPIPFPAQLRHHLRALRKKRGLTQAQAGALIGVSQARIAEIEAQPGLVSLDQLMHLLAVLGAGLALSDAAQMSPATDVELVTAEPAAEAYRVVLRNAKNKGVW
ncbi:MAG TPA: helix-turn-helix domain-containing protein [Burkholderiaceae bacterium]